MEKATIKTALILIMVFMTLIIQTLDVSSLSSIAIVTSALDFGSCTPASTTGSTIDTITDTVICTAASEAALELGIENDGDIDLNITIKTDNIAVTFIGGTSPTFEYMTFTGSSNGGCMGGAQDTSWIDFAATDTEYAACSNLTYGGTTNELDAEFKLFLPADAPPATDSVATITFTAHVII